MVTINYNNVNYYEIKQIRKLFELYYWEVIFTMTNNKTVTLKFSTKEKAEEYIKKIKI